MLRSVPLSVCLSLPLHGPYSSKQCILGLWLLLNINRKPRAWKSNLYWLAWPHGHTRNGNGTVAGATVTISSTAFASVRPVRTPALFSEAIARWQHHRRGRGRPKRTEHIVSPPTGRHRLVFMLPRNAEALCFQVVRSSVRT